ncbi:hypothetical protein C8034_v004409 [Colletotrichum sidae]|uniref:Uncharacterized protein n=1 Tax=Colletotrichum sidae TaxID=1347389 RepID=A0A4R8T7N2_9PEZI|nr:hypothetical protein C8034_v004409 [Colletotrichum sidae]
MAVLNPLFERSSPVRLAKAVIDILMINQYSKWSCMVAHFVHKGYLPTKKEYYASNPKSNARIFPEDEGKVIEIAVDDDVEEERWDWTSMPPLKNYFIWDAKIQTLSCWDSIAKETATWEFPQLFKANAAAERELQAGKGSAGGNLGPPKLAIVAPHEDEHEIQAITALLRHLNDPELQLKGEGKTAMEGIELQTSTQPTGRGREKPGEEDQQQLVCLHHTSFIKRVETLFGR